MLDNRNNMKVEYISRMALLMLAVSAVVAAYIQRPTKVVYEATTIHSTIMPKTIDEWDVLIMAMCEVESGSNPNAVGSKDDIGVLQITPIYVEEANRILGRDVYSLEIGRASCRERVLRLV